MMELNDEINVKYWVGRALKTGLDILEELSRVTFTPLTFNFKGVLTEVGEDTFL